MSCKATRATLTLILLLILPVTRSVKAVADEKPPGEKMAPTLLEDVTVLGESPDDAAGRADSAQSLKKQQLVRDRRSTGDTAVLFKDIPGVTLNANGGVSSLPAVHGMADDRLKITVNGMNVTSACSNHMNPALSYIAPNNVGRALLLAGVTPVSMGGDSIGGTIVVDPAAPRFTEAEGVSRFSGQVGGFFRSGNDHFGNNASAQYATRELAFDYNGSWSKAGNTRMGDDGPAVVPTRFLATNHYLRAARALGDGYVAADVSLQHIPYQGFPNQRMDVVANNAVLGGIRFEQRYAWGTLDGRAYHHQTWHTMDTLEERHTAPMPMRADGTDTGYRLAAEIPWDAVHTLRLGNEFARQTLNDWWPGNGTSQPFDFLSVHRGERNRMGTFAEWQAAWNDRWTTQLGARNDVVWMDTAPVHGYYPEGDDLTSLLWAPEFNDARRARTDANADVTTLLRYTPNAIQRFDVGFARKTRSPNLYERYAWYGHNSMVSWFGDGNAWAGNLDLAPEVAYNFTASASWSDPDRGLWSFKVSPHYAHVTDYIFGQAEQVASDGFRGMRFINLPHADLYGADASGRYTFLPDSPAGSWAARGSVSYTRGVGQNGLRGRPCAYADVGLAEVCAARHWPEDGLNAPDKVNLYHIMPLHGALGLEHTIKGEWGSLESVLSIELVRRKTTVAKTYGEPVTAGYALLNLQNHYQIKSLSVDFGVDNLLDKRYAHPLSGIDIVATYNQGFPPPALLPLPAMGRSVFVSFNLSYN